MKSLIFKKFSTHGNVERMEVLFMGFRVYLEEWTEEKHKCRPIGFIRTAIIEDLEENEEDYYPEED